MATRGSSRCCERPANRALRSRLAFAAQAACDVDDERLSALIDLMLLWLLAAGQAEWRLLGSRRRSAAPWGDPRLNSQ